MPQRTIVVVGAALGGPTAARAAREVDSKARVVLLERADELNPVACTLAQLVSGEAGLGKHPAREFAASLKRDLGVTLRTGQEVEAIDAGRKRLTVNGKSMRYDALIWAAGAESELPTIRGLRLAGRDPAPENVARFRTLRDLRRIRDVQEAGGRRAAVLGGGYLGVEAADSLRRAGFEVQLLEREARLLSDFPSDATRLAKAALAAEGVTVRLRCEVRHARLAKGRVKSLVLADGKEIPVDLVVIAAGVRPRSGAPAAAGAAVDDDGALLLDGNAATSLPGVYACGVCAAVPQLVTGRPRWSAQAAVAEKTARVAGACAAGGDRRLTAFAGTALVRAGGLVLGRTGLSASAAEAHAPGAVVEVALEAPARDAIFRDESLLRVRLRCHRDSGRLLGGELFGSSGVDKRVDVLATALAGELDMSRLALLDLGFSAPFSPVSDPLSQAAELAEVQRRRA